MAEPVRTCVGCRRTAAKAELLRLAWEGAVVADVSQIAPGRGAYLHRRPECLDQAIRKRAVTRALRVATVDTTQLGEVVRRELGT